jgi:hypothetical protein
VVTPEMSIIAQHALEDMVDGELYLSARSQPQPWQLFPRTCKTSFDNGERRSTVVDLNTVTELLDLGFLEGTSNRTFVVSKAGHCFYRGRISRPSA